MTDKELQTWWSYWTPEYFEMDERNTNGGKYRPLPVPAEERTLGRRLLDSEAELGRVRAVRRRRSRSLGLDDCEEIDD